MPELVALSLAARRQSGRPTAHTWAWWPMWSVLFVALSYKRKVLGEAAVRPLYLAGVAFGALVIGYLAMRLLRTHRLQWQSPIEALTASTLMLTLGYVLVQSLLYPSSFNDVVYAITTAFLLYALSLLAIAVRGWHASIHDVCHALLIYSLGNIVLVALSIVSPPAVDGILVNPLVSGFGTRVSGIPGDPTHLGALMSVALLLMFVLRREQSSRWRWLWVFLLLGGILATGSRNSLLSLLIGCVMASASDRRGALALAWLTGAGVLLSGLAVTIIAAVPVALVYFTELFRVDDPNAYSRFQVWSDMAQIASRLGPLDWLLGGGFLFIQDVYGSPYNAFLRMFFNHGLIVTAALILATLALFGCAVTDRITLRRQAVLGFLAYWLSFSMFLDTLLAEFFHVAEFCFWFAAAIITARTLRRRPDAQAFLPQ